MQRRLMVAMVGIALAAVVFVGAGVLTLAQIGARAETERNVQDGLDALAGLTERSGTVETVRGLDQVRNAFGLNDLSLVVVDEDGVVYSVQNVGPTRRGPRQQVRPKGTELTQLTTDELAEYQDGDSIFIDGPRFRSRDVVGVRILAVDAPSLAAGESLGLIAQRRVSTVADEARVWFVVSALAVVTLAAIAAWLLARRFTRPITDIERATAGIAAGEFDVRVNANGEDELAQLGRSVNRMAADLQRSKALDQQFLMSVSHDLRTPLTAIAGYAEALRDGAAADTAHAGEVIGNQAARLERLVGDLLDLARLDANRFTFDTRVFDASVVVGRTIAGLQPAAHIVGIELRQTQATIAPVLADPDRLAQCVGNIIDNALKFAASRVDAVVDVADGNVRIDIIDDGPGIAPQDLPHVFERLYMGASRPERAENPTGMGLAIVRELIGAMGGSVAVAAPPGGGTTMTLLLPLHDGGAEGPDQPTTADTVPAAGRPGVILPGR